MLFVTSSARTRSSKARKPKLLRRSRLSLRKISTALLSLCPKILYVHVSNKTCTIRWRVRCESYKRSLQQLRWTLKWLNLWRVSTASCSKSTARWTLKKWTTSWDSSPWKQKRWACSRRWCRTSSIWWVMLTQINKLMRSTTKFSERSACQWTEKWQLIQIRLHSHKLLQLKR